jgi:hypothetical protein
MFIKISLVVAVLTIVSPLALYAQTDEQASIESSEYAEGQEVIEDATSTAAAIIDQINAADARKKNVTQPEEPPEKAAIISLFESRKVDSPGVFNFMAYWVQEAVAMGIPANTIFLILLTPILATLVSLVRVVVGLPTLDMLVPITLAFAFVAVGVVVGLLILIAILCASFVSKILLSRMKIMFYPKRSLSMLLLAIFVFGALTLAYTLGFTQVLSLSIFPILILMLLGDSIVSVQLHKSAGETFIITGTTLIIGLFGYFLATNTATQDTLILYPELILLAIPVNIMIGRYFGLRLFEYFRFNTVSD